MAGDAPDAASVVEAEAEAIETVPEIAAEAEGPAAEAPKPDRDARGRRAADRHRRAADLADRRSRRRRACAHVRRRCLRSLLRTPDGSSRMAGQARMADPSAGHDGLPFLGRPAQPTGGLDSLWAESNREVAPLPRHPVGGRPARRPAVRQLRPVTLRHRSVLPALRDLPGRLTRRPRRSSLTDLDPGRAIQQRLEEERQPRQGDEGRRERAGESRDPTSLGARNANAWVRRNIACRPPRPGAPGSERRRTCGGMTR